MTLRLQMVLAVMSIYILGGFLLTRWALDQVRPRYLESMEETLVDTSVLLASMVETQLLDGQLDADALAAVVGRAQSKEFSARIFSLIKMRIDTRVYATDDRGIVIYDSYGRDVGADYSQWNDVRRTLDGSYGARSSRLERYDDATQMIYVAAPVMFGDGIIGVVSAGKPTEGINELVEVAKRRLAVGAIIGGALLLLAILIVAGRLVMPLDQLIAHVRKVRDGHASVLPRLPGKTLPELGHALEEMRDALEGRKSVERYTQTLAHEIKAPLTAIRGAAELLGEDLPAEERERFLGNIIRETARIHRIVERLIELSSLEARRELGATEPVVALDLATAAVESIQPAFVSRGVELRLRGEAGLKVRGETGLLREAILNLLQNALDFSSEGDVVEVRVEARGNMVALVVADSGPGIPEYAINRVFERFYSLPRPDNGRKSTGLGLSLVQEIVLLHGGETDVVNRPGGGACAEIRLPAIFA